MRLCRFYRCVVSLGFVAAATQVHADEFGMFSQQEGLKGHVIVDVGNFEKIEHNDGNYSTTEILRLNSHCFKPVSTLLGLWGYSKKAGLILIDKNNSIKIALIESNIGAIKVEAFSVVQVSCPAQN